MRLVIILVSMCFIALWLRGGRAFAEQSTPTEDPNDLVTVGNRTFRHIHPLQYPDNDREFIIDHLLFNPIYTKVRHWRMVPEKGCSGQEWTSGYTPIASWQAQQKGSVLTLRGEVEADLTEFAFLRVRAMASKSVLVTVKADIDGKRVPITEPTPGVDGYGEYVGPISGKRLTAVEVSFESSTIGQVSSSVMWVMAVKSGNPTPFPKPDPAWPGMLTETAVQDPTPTIGMIFDTDELSDIRKTLHSPAFAESWGSRISEAEEALKLPLEERASSILANSTKRYGRTGIDVDPFTARLAQNLAYVGLVEKRADMLRYAARWALTRTKCKRWVSYGVEALDGLPFSHGRFKQSDETYAMAMVLDWAGSALTPAGRDTVAKAIHDLGVVDIDGIMQPDSYVWNCNQGLVFEKGRYAGAIAVRQWYPDEYARREADARKMLRINMKACVKPDGTGMEGPAYWQYTIMQIPSLAFLLGRVSGEPMTQLLPPEVEASARWAWVNRRTNTKELRLLTYSSSGYKRAIKDDIVAFFAGPLGIPEYMPFARDLQSSNTDPLFLQFINALPPEDLVSSPPKTLTVFRDGGQVDIRQADEHNGMRIYFLSGEWGGKAHGDRNSFILEAFGQTLLLDRATSYYTHPMHQMMVHAAGHNTIVPDNRNQTKKNGKLGARLLQAKEQGPFVLIESDAALAWPGMGKKVLRRLFHLRPATVVVEDVVEWKKPAVTHQYWQSNGEWRQTPEGWVAEVNGVELCVTVLEGNGVTVKAAPHAIDGLEREVFRLDVATPKSQTARIITLLQVRPNDKAPWPCTANWSPEKETLGLTLGDGQMSRITWTNGIPQLEGSEQ